MFAPTSQVFYILHTPVVAEIQHYLHTRSGYSSAQTQNSYSRERKGRVINSNLMLSNPLDVNTPLPTAANMLCDEVLHN